MTLVMKFGGTSVADAAAIARVCAIVERAAHPDPPDLPPVVVVSALAGVTDRLIETARLAGDGDADLAVDRLRQLLERHLDVAAKVVMGTERRLLEASIQEAFDGAIELARALAVLRDVSPRSLDALVAVGELVSSRIVAAALVQSAVASVWVDARSVIVTDSEHSNAAPDMSETETRSREHLSPPRRNGHVPVLGGFIGATRQAVTTTLGRGGSDYSAAVVGACLEADEIQIWTDVDGMLTADPRIISEPQLVPQLTFAEASELAYFGAKVLHPSTILPAVAKGIPVRILNARKPGAAGTLITAERVVNDGNLTAIACKRDVTVVDITSTRMLMAHGFLRRLFEVFERFKTPVDVVTTSEVSVSVTVDDTSRLDAIVDNLRHFADVSIEPRMAIVCLVGEHLLADPMLFARAVTALEPVPLRLVSQAASRRNITFVLRDADVRPAMERLHEAFFAARTPAHGGHGG